MFGSKQDKAQPEPVAAHTLHIPVVEYEKHYEAAREALQVASGSGSRWDCAKAMEMLVRLNCAVRGIDYRAHRRGK